MDLVSRAYRTLGQEFVYFMSHSKCISRAQHSSIANQPITLVSRAASPTTKSGRKRRSPQNAGQIYYPNHQLGGCKTTQKTRAQQSNGRWGIAHIHNPYFLLSCGLCESENDTREFAEQLFG
jgi:hypothetical protein